MAERFERLYKLPEKLYIDGAPIIILAGALLKDTATGSVVAQIKFHSISEKSIKAIKVSLCAYDVSGSEIEGVKDYQYLDLSVRNGEEFGSNKAIVLPSPVTRSFSILDIIVVFSDDNQWKCEDATQLKELPTPKYLRTQLHNSELEKQYKISTTQLATYVPSEIASIWSCTCGEWNVASKCTRCGSVKKTVFSALNVDALQIETNKRLATEQAQREEEARIAAEAEIKHRELKEKRKKAVQKRSKIITIIGVPVVVVILLFTIWINPHIIQPNIKYSQAIRLIEEGQDQDAYNLFLELKNFKESEAYLSKFDFILLSEQGADYEKLYNENGLLSQYTNSNSVTYTYEYDSSNRLISEESAYASITYNYDNNDNLVLEREISSSQTHEWKREYFYDSNNNLIQQITSSITAGETTSYTFYSVYNSLNQLVIEYSLNPTHNYNYLNIYEYDSQGNCIKKESYTANSTINVPVLNSLTEDNYKNLIDELLGGYSLEYRYGYEFDYNNQLLREEKTSKNGSSKTNYEYDNSVLIKKTTDGVTTTYTYDEVGNLITEKTDSGISVIYSYLPIYREGDIK